MRLEMVDATGCPVPQFIIKADTNEERLLLKAFVHFRDQARDSWVLGMHGYDVDSGAGVSSFNFGWSPCPDEPRA